jgi:enolase
VSIIADIKAYEILDSRGNPTVACKVRLEDGSSKIGYVPSGASTGQYEALELRDNDEDRYGGKGVQKAVETINTAIKKEITGMDADNLAEIDKKMIDLDGTPNKTKLGGNSTLAVSMACAKSAAVSNNLELYEYLSKLIGIRHDKYKIPIPLMNILNGGKHAVGSTDFQEFMIVPVTFPSLARALQAGAEIYHSLAKILDERSYQPLVGDEGGFAPSLFSNEQAMELLIMSIKDAGYTPGEDVYIALDPAASRFYSEGIYQLHRENRSLTTEELVQFYANWVEKFPIISIEDGLDENDWDGWRELTSRIGDHIETIGDDLYATNKELLKRGIEHNSSTGILIKPNQIGTLSEAVETIRTAIQAGFKIIISHRSGETEDHFIADLAVACGCGAIKTGAPARSERTAKYNRLLMIESDLGERSEYSKWEALDTANN